MIDGRNIATNHANVVSMRCPAAWKLRIPRCRRPVIRPLHGQGGRKVTQHKNLWLVDLETGRRAAGDQPRRRLLQPSRLDIWQDSREVILERVLERSDVVLLDLCQP